MSRYNRRPRVSLQDISDVPTCLCLLRYDVLEKAFSQKQQANVCTLSTPTEYGNASPASVPTDVVSTGSDDVTEDCGDVGEMSDASLPSVTVTSTALVRLLNTAPETRLVRLQALNTCINERTV